MNRWSRRSTLFALAILLLLPFDPAPASAQTSVPAPRYGIGFVANTPDLLGGFGGYVMTEAFGGLGIYVDYKFDALSPTHESSFDPARTAFDVEDQVSGVLVQGDRNSWQSANVALVRPMTRELMLYGGLGYAKRTHYREYFDPQQGIGEFGYLWVEDPGLEKTTINVMFGLFMRMSSRVSFQTGIETAPRGFTAGVSLRLPGS